MMRAQMRSDCISARDLHAVQLYTGRESSGSQEGQQAFMHRGGVGGVLERVREEI